jgi:glycosyltransferase involved in cell wall biosynthesis
VTATVHQLVPSVVPGDATTSHSLQLKKLLEEEGYHSEIYATAVHPQLEDQVRLVGELAGPSRSRAFLVYQFAAYSELADWLIGRREKVALNYHNLTPHCFFRRYDRRIALAQQAAEVQLSQLSRQTDLAICDSAFNATDIERRGHSETVVSPVLLDLADLDADPDPATTDLLRRRREVRGGGPLFLCVGGIAPHKAQHDLVFAFAVYRRVYDPTARLCLVGRTMVPRYGEALRSLVEELDLGEWVDMPGGVTHEQLLAYYRSAEVFVGASEHEGFCVPLVEAMHLGVPVVAYAAGAVPDTLGEGGVLVGDKAPSSFAAAMWRVASDPVLHEALRKAGRRRASTFSLGSTRASMAETIRNWTRS